MNVTINIGIYCPHVFHVRSGTNQYYSTKFHCEHLSPPSMGRGREEQYESKVINSYFIILLHEVGSRHGTNSDLKSNQRMRIIRWSHNIQSWVIIENLTRCHYSWHFVIYSITTAGMTLNRTSIMSRFYSWSLKQKYNIYS